MNTVTFIGTLGAGMILVGFILNQMGTWDEKELRYDILNFGGGMLLVVYALLLPSYPFLVLNGVWTLVSLRDILRKI